MTDQLAIARFRDLTDRVLPAMASEPGRRWPVRFNHCFARIILDNVCGGVWYDFIAKPAYKNMSATQAREAVRLGTAIMMGAADIWALNTNSLKWRGKL